VAKPATKKTKAGKGSAVAKARRHRESLAEFGLKAMQGSDIGALIQAASVAVAEGLDIERSKVLTYRAEHDDLLVAAGVGWNKGVVGHATLGAGWESPPGRAFQTGQAVFIECILDETDFVYSDLLREHGVVALVNVPIKAGGAIYGILEVDSAVRRRFSEDDRNFLTSFANLVAAAVQRESLLDELRAAKETYQQASLAKGRILAAAGHDLKQPLQVIRASLEMVSPFVSPVRHRRHLERAERAVGKLDHALDRLIYASQIESGEVQPRTLAFPIDRILGALADEFAATAKDKGVDFHVVRSSARIVSDPDMLDSILQNLISNAVKYTDAGRVLVGCRRHGDMLSVEVHDTGIGIPPEAIDTIFEEFRQIQSDREGLGLGLSIVRRAADLLGHELSLRSIVGGGSCFRLKIRVANEEP
jgi:signal transduction histidine kinase